MTGHRLEVADVFRKYGAVFLQQFGKSLSTNQKRVFRAICICRTAALGGRKHRCNRCGSECIVYNACRNRHCPQCQAKARADWTDAREAEALPIPSFHVVFTLPREVGPLALQNRRVVYGILFRAAAETLKELAADRKHLGAEIGVLAVLHSWSQTLLHHPHIHCIVSGGGISPDGKRWIPCKRSKRTRKPFFVHVDVLGAVFKGKFRDFLQQAFQRGELQFHGALAELASESAFNKWLSGLPKKWLVYAEPPPPSSDTGQLVRYLARYTHRVAISNDRLIDMKDGKVRFSYKDYADQGKWKTMELEATEFIRRFLLHVLPNGFMKVRYYGFLANRFRKQKLDLCRRLLGVPLTAEPDGDEEVEEPHTDETESDTSPRCPVCKIGVLVPVAVIPKQPIATSTRYKIATTQRAPPRRNAG